MPSGYKKVINEVVFIKICAITWYFISACFVFPFVILYCISHPSRIARFPGQGLSWPSHGLCLPLHQCFYILQAPTFRHNYIFYSFLFFIILFYFTIIYVLLYFLLGKLVSFNASDGLITLKLFKLFSKA